MVSGLGYWFSQNKYPNIFKQLVEYSDTWQPNTQDGEAGELPQYTNVL